MKKDFGVAGVLAGRIAMIPVLVILGPIALLGIVCYSIVETVLDLADVN